MSPRVLGDNLSDIADQFDVIGSQWGVVGASKRSSEPIEMLLFGLSLHVTFNRRATDILPK
jgi:hypothetical protein